MDADPHVASKILLHYSTVMFKPPDSLFAVTAPRDPVWTPGLDAPGLGDPVPRAFRDVPYHRWTDAVATVHRTQ